MRRYETSDESIELAGIRRWKAAAALRMRRPALIGFRTSER
jgi:hypothetical protein